ncbi:hypothetical protein HELRODRAFT_140157, partial [Helobdella robusta]|uniref:Cadherin domain-containing protein n=1 Tax=Helobdella robusta TaxID=6412 RepID=T1EJ01_HELRO
HQQQHQHHQQQQNCLPARQHFSLQLSQRTDTTIEPALNLIKSLDRELCSTYKMDLVVTDGGTPPLSSTLQIFIQVTDSNDNIPAFLKPQYEAVIAENCPIGTFVTKIEAFDNDVGTNGQIEYFFSEPTNSTYGGIFKIDRRTGEVTVDGTIDYESSSIFHLSVEARDKGIGSIPVDVPLIVKVANINDNSPNILVSTLSSNSVSNKYGNDITVAEVSEGMGAEQLYNNSNNNSTIKYFKMDAKSGAIFANAILDREKVSRVELTIQVRDSSHPQLSSTARVRIHVRDVNDHKPIFFVILPSSSSSSDSEVGTVRAYDDDADPVNNIVRYRITSVQAAATSPPTLSSSSLFSSSSTGLIRTMTSLDREVCALYVLTIEATDGGSPPLTGTTTAKVYIQDRNDNRPIFTWPQSLN